MDSKDTDPRSHFLRAFDIGDNALISMVGDALYGADDGELYCQSAQSEILVWKDGRIEQSDYSDDEGFGLRRVIGDYTGFVYSNDFDPDKVWDAGKDLCTVENTDGTYALGCTGRVTPLYPSKSPLEHGIVDRISFLESVDAYTRGLDPHVCDVSVSLAGEIQKILIVRGDGNVISDTRPLVRLNISVLVEKDGKREWGRCDFGGREDYTRLFKPELWQDAAQTALREAQALLEAGPCPAGEMPIIIGPSWGAILLHEAIGHGLEGDFIRKKTSAFTNLLGKSVGNKDITIVDDGTIAGRRGSLSVDDEGTPTTETILIEDGVVVGFMHDRLSARHFGVTPTGNGRRESYKYSPMPRMTNTIMRSGPHSPEEIIAETKNGLYFKSFSGGEVDIATGKFVFNAKGARLIENGKLGTLVKGATLIGLGFDVLTHVDMVGNDSALDLGIGTCGKEGQSVPVGVGQPTIRVNGGVIVGGTGIEGGGS